MVRRLSLTRDTILVLVDEIGKAGPRAQTRSLIEAIDRQADTVVVGRCYLSPSRRHRKSFPRQELYGFDAQDFEAKVATFASQLALKHKPSFIICFGWENPLLVVAFDRLDLPVVCYIDAIPHAEVAEDQLDEIIRLAAYIVVRDKTLLSTLGKSRPTLNARGDATTILNDFRTESSSSSVTKVRLLRTFSFGAGKSAERQQPSEALNATADSLIALGRRAMEATMSAAPVLRHDKETIEAAGLFSDDLCRSNRSVPDKAASIMDYLRASRRAAPRHRPFAGSLLRRPAKGFNPLVYASENAAFDELRGEDPLAPFHS